MHLTLTCSFIVVLTTSIYLEKLGHGAPTVMVKGRTQLYFTGIFHTAEGSVLLGELRDQDLRMGLPARSVQVTISWKGNTISRQTMTDEQGRFRIPLPERQVTFAVAGHFEGDEEYAGQALAPTLLDVAKQNMTLELDFERELDASQPWQNVTLTTRADGRPISVAISIQTSTGQLLAQLETDERGQAHTKIPTAALGSPGPVTLVAAFAGNERINAAERRYEAVLLASSRLSLAASKEQLSTDDLLHFEGMLSEEHGPIARGTISLECMGRHVASTLTDNGGHYSFTVPADHFPPGLVNFSTAYTPSQMWRKPAVSEMISITIFPPRPLPLSWIIWPTVLTVLVLVVVLVFRYWPQLISVLGTRVSALAPSAEEKTTAARSGVHLSRPGFRALRLQSTDVSGKVWDGSDNLPLAAASILLTLANGETRSALADQRGHFALEHLPAGLHHILVTKQGYVQERFSVQIPHRGTYHDLRVDLAQVRVRLMEIYADLTLSHLPRSSCWACWTPREIAHHISKTRGKALRELDQLTLLLEKTYWSGNPESEAVISTARQLAERAVPPR